MAPVDVVDVFVDLLLDPDLTGDGVITGSINGAGQRGTVSGSVEIAGENSSQELVVSFGGVETKTATIARNGEHYTRRGDGPWVHQPAAAGISTPRSLFLEVLADLEDDGVEQVDGQPLHHLVRKTPADLSADVFGLDDPTITDFVGAVDFYARSDGTPALLRFALEWKQAGTAIEMELQYHLDLESTPTIARPDDVWTSFTSDRFAYTIAYPELWVFDPVGDGDDAFDLLYTLPSTPGPPGEVHVYFYPDLVGVLDATDWFAKSSALLVEVFGIKPEISEPITVASLESRYFALHYSEDEGGPRTFFQSAVVFDGSRAWVINMYSRPGHEADDRAGFDLFLSTFQPVRSSLAVSNVWGLEPGECFTSLPLFAGAGQSVLFIGGVDAFEAVDCGESHTGEVIGSLADGSGDSCETIFEDYVGRSLAGSAYGLLEMVPVEADDAPPSIGSLCVVAHGSGSSTGSAAGSSG